VTLHALVVADGDVAERGSLDRAWPGWDQDVAFVVAADGGAGRASRLGRRPDLVVGDLDSLDDRALHELEAAGVPVERASSDKDESDTELAVLAAVDRGATRITIAGAFGGPRLDHGLANAWLLAHPALAGRDARLVDAHARVRLLTASDTTPVEVELDGRSGDLVTLLPFGGPATGITTRGLRYPLVGDALVPGPARGLSNVRLVDRATVSVRGGALLIVEVPIGEGGLSSLDDQPARTR
jgi:thiamine pyrophosphokinase